MNFSCDVCVVGNGAIGKATALGFSQAGLHVVLLAPQTAPAAAPPSLQWDLRVYALNHVARELLSSLRVWQALDVARVAPVDAMRVYGDGDGGAKAGAGTLGFDAYGARTDALAWIVEDSNLAQALDAALQFAPKLQVVNGRASVLDNGGDRATVRLDNGDTITAALVVGADGAQSWVRNQCDIALDYRSYHQRAVVANFACEQPHHGIAYQWFTQDQGIVALLPLPGQRVSLVWSAPETLAATLLREPVAQLAQRLTDLPDHELGSLSALAPEACRAFPLALQRPHAIVAPRVALVGDAAHVVHPLAGHGMNLGFADVAALLKTLTGEDANRELAVDCGDARLLARYQRARKEEILLMQLATDGLERLFATDFEPLRLLRNAGLNLLDKFPTIKRRMISQAMGK